MAHKEELKTLLAKLTPEDLEALRELVLESVTAQLDSEIAGMTTLYNRSENPVEFQYDSRVYVIKSHKYVQFPTDIARHAVRKSQYLFVGTEDVKHWLVPQGYEGFGIPLSKVDAGLTGDPINDYPIPLAGTIWEEPVRPGEREVFDLGRLPPRLEGEPPIAHRPGEALNVHAFGNE